MKKTLIVANWKMNLNVHESSLLAHRLNAFIKVHRTVEVVLAPGFVALQPLSLEIDRRKFKLAAQNAHYVDEGAFTGEVSFNQLRNLVEYCIIGHSERRHYFHETLEVVRDKVQAAVRNDVIPILCVGETKQERLDGHTKVVVHDQLTTALANLNSDEIEDVVIAYEPVWAIGTGTAATPSQVAEVIKWIRHIISELYGASIAENIRVIYGASVEPDFVRGLLSVEGVDGFLVGGASLVYQKFASIVDNAYHFAHEE
jgi:triosephosphate isomerase